MLRLRFGLMTALGLAACSAGADTPRTADPPPATRPVQDGKTPDVDAEPGSKHTGTEAKAERQRASSFELTFVGDVIFGRYRASGYDPIPEDGHRVFEAMAEALGSDFLVGNLETPLVRELPTSSPIGSRFQFGGSLEHARLLVDAGFDAMSLANNHWFDMRLEGVEQTPAILEELGVVPLGRARSEPPTFRVETVERKGLRLGFVAATTRTNAPVREKLPKLPYLRTRELVDTVGPLLAAARDEHDLLIVVLHWGDEYADVPTYTQIKAAHGLVDAGADLVIGHHPHVLQGVEVYEGGVIAYSLGNFLFENTNAIPRQTGVLRTQYRVEGRCVSRVVFHPAFVKRMPVQHPVPATEGMGRRVRKRMVALGKKFDTRWTEEGEDLVLNDPPCERTVSSDQPAARTGQ